MKTTIVFDGVLSDRLTARKAFLSQSGANFSKTELALSLLSEALDRADAMDLVDPLSGNRYIVHKFIGFKKPLGRPLGMARHVFRDDGEEFDGVSEAAKAHGVTTMSIYCALTGRTKTCCGHTWSYAD